MEYIHTIICRVLAMTEPVRGRCLLVDCEVSKLKPKSKWVFVSIPKTFNYEVVIDFCKTVTQWVKVDYKVSDIADDAYMIQFTRKEG